MGRFETRYEVAGVAMALHNILTEELLKELKVLSVSPNASLLTELDLVSLSIVAVTALKDSLEHPDWWTKELETHKQENAV